VCKNDFSAWPEKVKSMERMAWHHVNEYPDYAIAAIRKFLLQKPETEPEKTGNSSKLSS